MGVASRIPLLKILATGLGRMAMGKDGDLVLNGVNTGRRSKSCW